MCVHRWVYTGENTQEQCSLLSDFTGISHHFAHPAFRPKPVERAVVNVWLWTFNLSLKSIKNYF